MKYTRARGFTLIELLVVIAIIGILASVVLASVNTARTKSKDASLLADMDSLTAQAVIYEDENRTYGDTAGGNDCTVGVFTDPTFLNVFSSADTLNGAPADKACYASDTSYAVAIQRPSSDNYTPPTVYWCLDNHGTKCGINDLTSISVSGCACP